MCASGNAHGHIEGGASESMKTTTVQRDRTKPSGEQIEVSDGCWGARLARYLGVVFDE